MKEDEFYTLNFILDLYLQNDGYNYFEELLNHYSSLLLPVYENSYYSLSSNQLKTQFDLNQSINICYEFLKKYNPEIAERFMNMLYATVDGKALIQFEETNGKNESVANLGGHAKIIYNNTANDTRTIIHELFHVLNEAQIDDENGPHLSFTNRFFSETVSVYAETLLNEYMYHNGYITDEESSILLNMRIKSSKEAAKLVILEKEYIDMRRKGIYIDYFSIIDRMNQYPADSSMRKIWQEEFDRLLIAKGIIHETHVTYPRALSYVVAQFVNEILRLKKDRYQILFELNDLISFPEADFDVIYEGYIMRKLKNK